MQTLQITKSPKLSWQFHSQNFDDKGIECLVREVIGLCWQKSHTQLDDGNIKLIYEDHYGNDITVDIFYD